MKRIRGLLVFFMTTFFLNAQSQQAEGVLSKWKYLNDANSAVYKYFAGQAFQMLDKRERNLAAIQSKKGWLERQSRTKKILSEVVGSFPAKTPLNPVVTGVAEKDGVRVEKLYFESLPGYYVTAAFFVPANRKGKLPVILFCSGHSKSGFRSRGYQRSILNFVKKGFAVLAFDPIGQGERRQYLNNELRSKFGPTQEHSYPGNQHFLLGRSPAYHFIWDGIRAIDYLYSRPEIDTARIGIAGRSGGGTQTAYIAAFDNRIKAAAPECYVTSYEKLIMTQGPQDAEQNFVNGIYEGLDIGDLVIAFAPKPMLLVTTTRDIFNIQGARDVFKEAKRAYTWLGKPDGLEMVEDDADHANTPKNSEATYRFFQKNLANPGQAAPVEVSYFEESELNVTSTGNVYTSLKGHNLHSLAALYLKEVLQKRNPVKNEADLKARVIEVTGYRQEPDTETPFFSGRTQGEAYHVESYLQKSITGSYFPFYRLTPVHPPAKKSIVLLLDENGKDIAIQEGGSADSLAKLGYEVIVPDLTGFGEIAAGYIKGGDSWVDRVPNNLWYTGILVKQSLLGVRMQELSSLINWLSEDNSRIETIAKGILTTDLLHLAVMQSNKIASVLLIDPLVSYQSVIEEANYKTSYVLSGVPGMIAQYDIDDLINSLSDKMRVLLVNPRNGAGESLNALNQNNIVSLRRKVKVKYENASFKFLDNWYLQDRQ